MNNIYILKSNISEYIRIENNYVLFTFLKIRGQKIEGKRNQRWYSYTNIVDFKPRGITGD